MFSAILATALITSPAELHGPIDAYPVAVRRLLPALQRQAIRLEIMDPRESRYVLTRVEDFRADLKLIRRRYLELRDAPSVHDAMRFPHRDLINELLTFNRAYRQHLDSRQALELTYWWELREALQETDRLYQVWDAVRDCRTEYYYVTVRRQALKKLRDEMLGDADFWAGRYPPHVPFWRFGRLD